MVKTKTPLMDEVEQVGQRLMAKVEQRIEFLLADNLVFTVPMLMSLLHTIGRLTLGDDEDVKWLSGLLSDNTTLIQEIVDNQPILKKRFAEPPKEKPCPRCGKTLVCSQCGCLI